MINEKYYNDIKKFPSQFSEGLKLVKDLKIEGDYNKAVVCGMGGSSLFVDMMNDFYRSEEVSYVPIFAHKGYEIPSYVDGKTLVVISSYSGNTEEVLSCFDDALARGLKILVVTTAGKLRKKAEKKGIPIFLIPGGLQPRLSTGYFISGLMKIFDEASIVSVDDLDAKLKKSAKNMVEPDEEKAGELALKIKGKVPIVYATDNNWSIARISKIKFNENSKTQSFWNYFPELNHNEMVGFSNMVMKPYFLIFKSKFTYERNYKRIEVFTKLMKQKGLEIEIIEMEGETVFEEILNAYNFIDYVTYFLAEEYGVDPEPVEMVEKFKEMIVE